MDDFHFRQGSGIQAIHDHLKIIGDIVCVCVIFLQTGFMAFIRHFKGLRTWASLRTTGSRYCPCQNEITLVPAPKLRNDDLNLNIGSLWHSWDPRRMIFLLLVVHPRSAQPVWLFMGTVYLTNHSEDLIIALRISEGSHYWALRRNKAYKWPIWGI